MAINRNTDLFDLAHNGTGHIGAAVQGREIRLLGLFGDFAGSDTVLLPPEAGEVIRVSAIGPGILSASGDLWVWRAGKNRWFRAGNVLSPPPRKKRPS